MNVPKLRFKEFNDEWKTIKLKDIGCKVNRVENNNAPIMMISAENGFILQSKKYSKDMTGESLKKYITLYKNEFAYNHGASKLRPYGSVFMLSEEKARIPFVYHCFNITEGYNKFFAYCLNRYAFGKFLKPLISSTARMDGLLNISFDNYFSIKFNIPEKQEQQKIADFLSTVDKKIENLNEIIENLEQQKKGVLQQIFSQKLRFKDENGNDYPQWQKKKLSEIGTIITGTTPSTKHTEYYSDEYLWVTPTDIIEKNITTTNKKLSKLGLQKGRIVPANSILVTCIASIGKNAILRTLGSCNQQINAITPTNNYNVDFIYYLICYKENLLHLYAGTGGMEILNKEQFSKISMLFPCLEEQQKIADFLSTFDRKIDNQKAQLEHWQQIKKGLLQQMFV